MFTVSQVNRTRSLSIFQIYISQSDSTGKIFTSESQVPTDENGARNDRRLHGERLDGPVRQ